MLTRDRGRTWVHDGESEFGTTVAGRLLHDAKSGNALVPATGDWVALNSDGAIEAVLGRAGTIARADDAGRDVLVANVDMLLVAHAAAEDPVLARLPRFLALAAEDGVAAVVLITKADLLEDPGAVVAAATDAISGAVPVIAVSSVDGTGIDSVRRFDVPGRTLALVGPSGAGKSTLINTLLGEERQATGAVRASDGRGRHITVRRELIALPGGGLLADTPGIRSVGVRGGVEEVFSDISAYAQQCRFSDCSHTSEPDCAVLGAIAGGELAAERLEAQRALAAEARVALAREEARAKRSRERSPLRHR